MDCGKRVKIVTFTELGDGGKIVKEIIGPELGPERQFDWPKIKKANERKRNYDKDRSYDKDRNCDKDRNYEPFEKFKKESVRTVYINRATSSIKSFDKTDSISVAEVLEDEV